MYIQPSTLRTSSSCRKTDCHFQSTVGPCSLQTNSIGKENTLSALRWLQLPHRNFDRQIQFLKSLANDEGKFNIRPYGSLPNAIKYSHCARAIFCPMVTFPEYDSTLRHVGDCNLLVVQIPPEDDGPARANQVQPVWPKPISINTPQGMLAESRFCSRCFFMKCKLITPDRDLCPQGMSVWVAQKNEVRTDAQSDLCLNTQTPLAVETVTSFLVLFRYSIRALRRPRGLSCTLPWVVHIQTLYPGMHDLVAICVRVSYILGGCRCITRTTAACGCIKRFVSTTSAR